MGGGSFGGGTLNSHDHILVPSSKIVMVMFQL